MSELSAMDAEAPATFHIVGGIRDQFKRDRAKMGVIEWSLDRVESLDDRTMILDVLGIRVVHVLADLIVPGPTLEGRPITESQDLPWIDRRSSSSASRSPCRTRNR